jgi:signal transduction histidine kinase
MTRIRWLQFSIMIVVAMGFVIVLFAVAEIGRMRLVEAASDVRRAQLQWNRIVDLQMLLMNAESAHRGYLLTGDSRFLDAMQDAGSQVDTLATELATTYEGHDPAVSAAVGELQSVADERMRQMRAAVALYGEQGQSDALVMATSAAPQATMVRFRDLANLTRDYEKALLEHSLQNWDSELAVVKRLNLATLLVGIVLASLAGTAMFRGLNQRQEAAAELARQHDELKAQAAAQTAELNELYRHLEHVQEEERARLSRGLHDELGGVLLAARMDITWMERHPGSDTREIGERLARVRKALDAGIDLKRRVVEELRPTLLDTMGLIAALRWQVGESCQRAEIHSQERYPENEPPFNRAGAIMLFRVVQEALTNVLKHARATEVEVALDVTDTDVVVSVRDNGVGASHDDLVRARSHGIAGMRHRVNVMGGRLDVSTAPGGGTCVRVQVPRSSVLQAGTTTSDDSGVFAAIPWAAGGTATT